MAAIEDALHESIEVFAATLRTLTNDLVQRRPNDATIWRAHRRITTGISIDPLGVVNTVGPYLYKYRDQIYNFDSNVEEFFMANNFDTELMEGVEQERVDLAAYIIPVVKEIARDLPREEKQPYIDAVVNMLDHYLEIKVGLAEA